MKRSRPVSLALVGLFVWVTGCTSYRQIRLAELPDHGKVRVTLTNGDRETIRDAVLTADSIKGHSGPPRHDDRAVAIDDVTAVEAGYTNVAGTVGLVVGLGLIAVLVVGMIQYSNTSFVGEGLFDDM